MSHILDILNEISATDSSKAKEKILGENKDNALLRKVFELAYNKRLTYGITPKDLNFTGSVGPMSLESFCDELIEKYSTRKLTGNAGLHYMQQMLDSMTGASCEVARRILSRDLMCGASVALGNKTWPGVIPEQPQYLAAPYSEKNLKKIKWPALAQLKADGARCMALISADGSTVSLVSRNGNEYLNLYDITSQLKEIAEVVRVTLPHYGDFVIDGELIHNPSAPRSIIKTPKQHTLDDLFGIPEDDELEDDIESDRNKSNGLSNKALNATISQQEQSEMIFNVWDIVPQDVYFERVPSTLWYENRFATLGCLTQEFNGGDSHVQKYPNIRLIESEEVETYEQALKVYQRYVDQDREGIILKNKDGLWANARTTDQIKFKVEVEIDLKIVEVYPHRKDKTKVGGFVLEDSSGQIRVRCGSGLKDTTHKKVNGAKVEIPISERHEYDRQALMLIKNELIGQIVQCKCNGLQERKGRKPNEAKFKLFLPIFQLIRRDKSKPNHIHDVFPDAILD